MAPPGGLDALGVDAARGGRYAERHRAMSKFVKKSYSFGALAYESSDAAGAAQLELRRLEREGEIELKDDAIVVKTPDGELDLKHGPHVSPKTGTLAGGIVGLLLGLAAGGPLGGVVLGAAAGRVAGGLGSSLSAKRLKELGESLEPGQAALCILVGEANWELLRSELAALGGRLLEARLTDEAMAALEEARAAERDAPG
jgi:uncharacterized membrane protein